MKVNDGLLRCTATISVLVVTYNSAKLLDACLQPLADESDIEIIAVDNDSSDDTVRVLRQSYPKVHVVCNRQNVGFGKAVNQAARLATGRTIVLVNPDSIVSADAIRALDAEVRREKCRVAGPTISQPSGRLSIHSAGKFPRLKAMTCHYVGLSRIARWLPSLEGHYLIPSAKERKVISTDWVTGAVLAIDASAWAEVGGLSERWFMYAEDIDLCWKIREEGYEVHLLTYIEAIHQVGSSDATGSRVYRADWIINLFDFYRLRYRPSLITSISWCGVVASGLCGRGLAYKAFSMVSTGERKGMWMEESLKFRFYAKALVAEVGNLLRRPRTFDANYIKH